MRQKVAKRLRAAAFDIYSYQSDEFGSQFEVYRKLKREYVRNKGRQNPKLKKSKRQQRLASKNN